MERRLEDKLAEIMDWVYSAFSDTDRVHLDIGIWQVDETPFTFYALLKDGDDIICGESSYDSQTITEAVDLLLFELYN